MRPRHIAPVALFLALTVACFIIARVLAERDVRRDSEQRAQVAAAQIHGSIAQAASLTESLSRFMLDASGTGVTSDQFARNALRWLSPARFPAAAWVEQVPASRRASYERRIGQPIVAPDESHRVVPPGSRSSYLPATLVSGFNPMAVPGTDLSGAPGMATALTRATRIDGVAATPIAPPRTGTSGLFLVAPAPNLIGEVLHQGYVVVFVSEQRLHAAADVPAVQIRAAGTSTEARESAETASKTFTAAGQRFDVVVPQESVQGAAAVLPWIILAGGLVVAALGAALGLNAARRARAQDELDRIFTLSSDLITVADFDGRFTRVNPAAEQILGYSEEELLARPYIDLVHPDDREKTAAEAAAISHGKATVSFENRFLRKDGSYKVLEWTSTPDVENRLMYAVARDVTERREAEAEVERLAEEQAALRRVATLVARDVSQAEVFAAIAEECAQLFGTGDIGMVRYEGDSTQVVLASAGTFKDIFPTGSRQSLGGENAASRVFRTGQPVRIDDYERASGPIAEAVRPAGLRSAVATPITVQGRLWGAMITGTTAEEPLPLDTESRLGQFTELMATAIANTESRTRADRLAEEQAALRRVATLVAEDVPAGELFRAVAGEAGALLGGDYTGMIRFEDDASVTTMATWAAVGEHPPAPERFHTEAGDPTTMIAETLEAARVDDWTGVPGPIAAFLREELEVTSSVGSPIVVEGRLWGALAIHSKKPAPLPPDTESRLQNFTELVGTAIANRSTRAEVRRLAEEQAALRRVATLVAKEAPPAEVFAKVAEELANVLGDVECSLFRDEGDGTASAVALSGAGVSAVRVGTRLTVDGDGVIASVLREGRPYRIGEYSAHTGAIAQRGRELGIRSAVGCPILVGGRIWGAIGAASYKAEAFPPESETRIAQFAHLVATAIANAEARAEVERLADEQAALRRVATLVAEGASPISVFDAVAAEMEALLDADQVALNRYEPGAEISVLAHRGLDVGRTPVGSRVSHEGESVTATVRGTGRPARMEHRGGAPGALAELAQDTGLRVSVGAPIVVDGRLWGIITASWKGEESPSTDTEERMAHFAELLDTAIANADSRDQLTASRARLLTEGDEARRRVVRDLHDGAQQRLVRSIMTLKLAQRVFREDDGEAESLIGEALEQVEQGNAELRELAHGILPGVLTHGGLRAGVNAVVTRLDLPVEVGVPDERFPSEIEASAYFIVAEALTNVVKHAHAGHAEVRASVQDGTLRLEVQDDGIGGADPNGHGLVGMGDRVTALGGRLDIESPASGGTLVAATLPLRAG